MEGNISSAASKKTMIGREIINKIQFSHKKELLLGTARPLGNEIVGLKIHTLGVNNFQGRNPGLVIMTNVKMIGVQHNIVSNSRM